MQLTDLMEEKQSLLYAAPVVKSIAIKPRVIICGSIENMTVDPDAGDEFNL